MRSEGSPLDLNNLPEEYGKQAIEESSTTTATSASSTRFKKKKCGKEGKEDAGNVYECRFCSLKFCKSQALGGHMNRHRQERETETLNRARQLVFSNDGFATVGAHVGLRDLNFGGSGQGMAPFPRGGANSADSCLQFRPVYPLLRPPSGQLQQLIYPAQTSPRAHPYAAAAAAAGDYYLGRVLAGSPRAQAQGFGGGGGEGNRARFVVEAAPPGREGGIGAHGYGLRSSEPRTDPF